MTLSPKPRWSVGHHKQFGRCLPDPEQVGGVSLDGEQMAHDTMHGPLVGRHDRGPVQLVQTVQRLAQHGHTGRIQVQRIHCFSHGTWTAARSTEHRGAELRWRGHRITVRKAANDAFGVPLLGDVIDPKIATLLSTHAVPTVRYVRICSPSLCNPSRMRDFAVPRTRPSPSPLDETSALRSRPV